jgi:D-amino peptidase
MEGASGVTAWDECAVDSPRYEFGRRMITQDVIAAIEGFRQAGAERIVVSDGHGTGRNFIYEDLPSGVEYVTGPGSAAPLPFLDDTFDAAGIIGQHAKWNTPNAFLAHTQSSKTRRAMWVNGLEIGEIGQFAIAAGHHRVPIIFITGDLAATREAQDLLGTVETVAVKEASIATRGKCLAINDAHRAIREGAQRSVGLIGKVKPYTVDLPMEVRVQHNETRFTEGPVRNGAERVDPLTIRRVVDSQLDVYRV